MTKNALTEAAKQLRDDALSMGGIEVPISCWPLAEKIADEGGWTLGPARGPEGWWRRLCPPGVDQD